jgi:hypothetical protein
MNSVRASVWPEQTVSRAGRPAWGGPREEGLAAWREEAGQLFEEATWNPVKVITNTISHLGSQFKHEDLEAEILNLR